ncbi:MAG: HNH endonuclease signature motif containing protein [Tepidisphaeraceae bacterium]
MDDTAVCQLCQRAVPSRLITLHHLKPKSRGGRAEHRVPLCKTCHKMVHATFENRELDKSLADVEVLRNHPKLAAFMAWIVKQSPERDFRTAASNQRGGKRKRRR